MRLHRLSLTHFRNYRHLDLAFAGPLTLLQGQNAQGKTNLLEAIFFLATSKPVHAQTEREVVGWGAADEPIPYARLTAEAEAGGRATELEIVLTARGDGVNFTKQIKINGAARRSMDLVGVLRAVLFLPEDIRLIDGGPGERRRYLDIALCQIDRSYCRALSAYQQVLTQRNSLLKNLREQELPASAPGVAAQLGFWDEKLVQHGAAIVARRHNFVQELAVEAQARHAELSQGSETLTLHYAPSFNPGCYTSVAYEFLRAGSPVDERPGLLERGSVAGHYLAKLNSRRTRELAAGNTLYGPHRDDLRLLANGRDLRLYGSRGQQRSAALALKLAELLLMTRTTGEAPLLLLDDVMSELDAQRRSTLLAALNGVPQAIITTTDWEDFAPDLRARAQCFHVSGGAVIPVVPPGAPLTPDQAPNTD
ncbi:MAG: DNA replication/repair protein RecF [Caldilineaceae bacterium]|nr:DNA replication/repair protein RecF [Caldilineaceae bacterium]